MSDAVRYRCPDCDAPLTFVDGRTRVPHLTWCPSLRPSGQREPGRSMPEGGEGR